MADNASTVRLMYQAFNDKDLDRLVSFCAPEARVDNVPFGRKMSVREYAGNFANGYPDARIDIERLIATERQVIAEYDVSGTNTGTYEAPEGKLSPTNRRIAFRMLEIIDFDDAGKVVGVTTYYDRLGVTRQLGLLPPIGVPERAEAAQPELRH